MNWQPTPVILPGKSHGQRRLVDYRLWGCKELDTTEQLNQQINENRKKIKRQIVALPIQMIFYILECCCG